MPETIEINNLYIDDSALGQKPHEIYLFADPCSGEDKESLPSFEKRPYPYNICKRVTCRKITVVGQRPIRISKNEELFRDVEITIED
jgi:hypothetical protein